MWVCRQVAQRVPRCVCASFPHLNASRLQHVWHSIRGMSSPLRGRSKSPLYKSNVSCTRSYSQLRIDVDVLCERLAASEAAKERYIKKYTTLNENYRALSTHNAKEEQLKEHTVSRWKEDHSALKDCRAELHSKSRELAAVRTESESLRSELGLMRSQFDSSEKMNSSTHARLRESENQRQQTERQNSELTINLDSYRKIRAELTDSLKEKDERLLAAHQMIAEFETQLRQSDEAKRQLELQVEEVTGKPPQRITTSYSSHSHPPPPKQPPLVWRFSTLKLKFDSACTLV
jgi:chromosome segregation ATPase